MKLKLSWPCKSTFITQKFGAKSPIYTQEGMLGHNGVDILAAHGAEVYASHDGTAYYQIDSAGGHGVVIITNDKFDDGNGSEPVLYKTIYWHLVDPIKEPQYPNPLQKYFSGKSVKAGELIGYADSTGQSTGDHLHWSLKKVAKDESNNSFYNLNQNNGYFGCEDPIPFVDTPTQPLNAFLKDLKYRMVDNDVKRLQQWLNTHGCPLAASGVGSSGNETTYFGELTLQAVISFQKAKSIEPSVGYVGSITREVINNYK